MHIKAQPFLRRLLLFLALASTARAQASADYAVMLSAMAQDDPPALVLVWPESARHPSQDYTVYRRTPGAKSWGEPIADGSAIATLEDGRRSFADTSVEVGKVYEYQVVKRLGVTTAAGQHHLAYGYLLAGIRAPLVEDRGTLVLVVEQSLAEPLAAELGRLHNDLVGDGWRVVRQEVNRSDSVVDIKARIKHVYDADPQRVKAVFLFGRVPVPYSGNFQPFPPDGHTAPGDDHRGAWPADVFYADMDGEWTDHAENYVNGTSARSTNVPHDGKFDPSYLPSDLELQIGRVDLSSLPGARAKQPYADEIALLRFYLDKNHEYRHARMPVRRKALVGDNLDTYGGRAYAASAFRSFAPMFGTADIVVASTELSTPREERWLTRLTADTYLWTFGAGGGSNTSASSLGHRGAYNDLWAADLVDEGAKGVFHFFFGSWFGDWDQPDNLMRTALVTRFGLAAAWSGRPHLVFHAMGLGETLGYCIRASQNNADTYHNQINTFRRGVHIALLGDPTLRLHPVPPPTQVQATVAGGDVVITWKPSSAEVLGYHVYREAGGGQGFVRLTETPISTPEFIDVARGPDPMLYMIRAVTLESTPSGSFFNASPGAFARVEAPAAP